MARPKTKECIETTLRFGFFEELLEAFPEARSKEDPELKRLKIKLTGYLKGKDGQKVKKMERDTSTKISYRGEHVDIRGSKEGVKNAKELIHEEIKQFVERNKEVDKVVPIAKPVKGHIMGKNGLNLKKHDEVSNGYTYRSHGEIRVRAPNEEEAERACQSLLTEAEKAKRRQTNRGQMECNHCFVDDLNLLQNENNICLKEYKDDGKNNRKEYILSAACTESMNACSQEGAASSVDYIESVQVAVKDVLGKVKGNSSNPKPWIDIWAHFGQVIISKVDEDKENEYFSKSEVQNLLKPPNGKCVEWKTRFREGINLQLEGCSFGYDSWELEDQSFVRRFDLGIRTPSHRSLRFKVWMARSDFNGDINELPLPNDDLQSVIGEVTFIDDNTRETCRGWLCTETQQPLKVNVIFPSLPFSFRFGIRKGEPYCPKKKDEQENALLLEHLKTFTKLDEHSIGAFDTVNVALPEDFNVIYKRLCKRITYKACSDNLSITLSEEESNNNSITRATYDVHVRDSLWNESLKTSNWKAETIAERVPTFLNNVRSFSKFLVQKLQPVTEEQSN